MLNEITEGTSPTKDEDLGELFNLKLEGDDSLKTLVLHVIGEEANPEYFKVNRNHVKRMALPGTQHVSADILKDAIVSGGRTAKGLTYLYTYRLGKSIAIDLLSPETDAPTDFSTSEYGRFVKFSCHHYELDCFLVKIHHGPEEKLGQPYAASMNISALVGFVDAYSPGLTKCRMRMRYLEDEIDYGDIRTHTGTKMLNNLGGVYFHKLVMESKVIFSPPVGMDKEGLLGRGLCFITKRSVPYEVDGKMSHFEGYYVIRPNEIDEKFSLVIPIFDPFTERIHKLVNSELKISMKLRPPSEDKWMWREGRYKSIRVEYIYRLGVYERVDIRGNKWPSNPYMDPDLTYLISMLETRCDKEHVKRTYINIKDAVDKMRVVQKPKPKPKK